MTKILNQGSMSKKSGAKGPFDSDDETEVSTVGSLPNKTSEKVSTETELEAVNIQEIVDRVTSNITGTLQTLIVSDRVLAAERNSSEWKDLCHLMASNPEIINKRMLVAGNPTTAMKFFGPDFSDLSKVNKLFSLKIHLKSRLTGNSF